MKPVVSWPKMIRPVPPDHCVLIWYFILSNWFWPCYAYVKTGWTVPPLSACAGVFPREIFFRGTIVMLDPPSQFNVNCCRMMDFGIWIGGGNNGLGLHAGTYLIVQKIDILLSRYLYLSRGWTKGLRGQEAVPSWFSPPPLCYFSLLMYLSPVVPP